MHSDIDIATVWSIVQKPKQSAAGPNGIPFDAYAQTEAISSAVLLACCKSLLRGEVPPAEFNYSNMVLLPKVFRTRLQVPNGSFQKTHVP